MLYLVTSGENQYSLIEKKRLKSHFLFSSLNEYLMSKLMGSKSGENQ